MAMIETWGLFILSFVALGLWLAVALHVRDDRAPYVWLLVLTTASLTIAGLATYAQAIPQEWARFAATFQRVVFVLAGGYALYRVTR